VLFIVVILLRVSLFVVFLGPDYGPHKGILQAKSHRIENTIQSCGAAVIREPRGSCGANSPVHRPTDLLH
jgi:hypothetical protein